MLYLNIVVTVICDLELKPSVPSVVHVRSKIGHVLRINVELSILFGPYSKMVLIVSGVE